MFHLNLSSDYAMMVQCFPIWYCVCSKPDKTYSIASFATLRCNNQKQFLISAYCRLFCEALKELQHAQTENISLKFLKRSMFLQCKLLHNKTTSRFVAEVLSSSDRRLRFNLERRTGRALEDDRGRNASPPQLYGNVVLLTAFKSHVSIYLLSTVESLAFVELLAPHQINFHNNSFFLKIETN